MKSNKFDSKNWRSAAIQIQVQLKEAISCSNILSTNVIEKLLKIMKQLVIAFNGTGYDEVFRIFNEIIEKSVFSDKTTVKDSEIKKIPYFELCKTNYEKKIVENSSVDFSSEVFLKKIKKHPSEIKLLKKTIAKQKLEICDLKYKITSLKKDLVGVNLEQNKEIETRSRAFSEMQEQIKKRDNTIFELKKKISILKEFSKSKDHQKKLYDKQKFSLLNFKQKDKIFDIPNRLRVIKNFNEQLELLENVKIHNYSKKILNEQVIEKRNKNSEFKKSKVQKKFVNDMKVLTNQINLLQKTSQHIIDQNEIETMKKKKSSMENLLEKDKVSESEIQEEKNDALKKDVEYWLLETLNPFNFNSNIELYVSKRKENWKLLHREPVTENFKPKIIELPEDCEKLKILHSRYSHYIPHENLEFKLFNSQFCKYFTNENERKQLINPCNPIFTFYIKKYSNNIPNNSRTINLQELRQLLHHVYIRDYNLATTYTYGKHPKLIEVLLEYIEEMYVLPIVVNKVFYEVLSSIDVLREKNEDIKEFYLSLIENNENGCSAGRCMTIIIKIINQILYFEIEKECEITDEKLKNVVSKIYSPMQNKQEMEVVLKAIRLFSKSTMIDVHQLYQFFFQAILKCVEYWCSEFVSFTFKMSNKKQKYKFDEFNFVMQKILKNSAADINSFRFMEISNDEDGEVDCLRLSRIYSSIKLMDALNYLE